MDTPLILGLFSALIALGAGTASVLMARKQARAARAQVIMNFNRILAEAGGGKFSEDVYYVRHKFPHEFTTQLAVGELPNEVRETVSNVVNFFDRIGLLIAFGALDKEIIIAYMGNWIDETWRALEGNIAAERFRRQQQARNLSQAPISTGYMVFFEHLTYLARLDPPPRIQRRMKLGRLPDPSEP